MTFYNPNIQCVFDTDSSFDLVLNNSFSTKLLVANYQFCFDSASVGSNSSFMNQTTDFFLNFVSPLQESNLAVVSSGFDLCFLDVVLKSYQFHISSFADYMQFLMLNSSTSSHSDYVYTKDRIFDFIELLLYADVANEAFHCKRHDYHKYLDKCDSMLGFPVYTTLYERLKFFNLVFNKMRLQVSNVRISPVHSIIYFDFSLWL